MPHHNVIFKEEVSNCGFFGARYEITFETTDFKEYMKVKDLCNELIKEREEDDNVDNEQRWSCQRT